ncbi:MAG: LysM peptidoglycan-binding domain-containing protein [Flavicella sp.]|nr:LysM peptidoglycan-binding domain-containing protein [Flavicella sp.]
MRKLVLLLSLSLFTFLAACGQQKKYISYKVQKGESVKEIAKKHDVKAKHIMRLNPGLKKKPTADTVILIPNVNYNEEEEKARVAAEVAASQNHIAQSKETLYGISKQYNVSIESLKELNPDLLIDGLKIGMVLEIPKEKMLTPEELRQNELDHWAEHYVLHTVIKDDTLYSLTRFYNVSEEELLELNPLLSEGLKLGSILKIKEKISEERLKELDALVFKDSVATQDTINVAMLLPFKFTKNDTLSKEQLFTTRNNLVSIITDFYLGADIAIDSIKKQGVHVDLKVYDSENNRDTIKGFIKSDKFKNTDVLFGPVFNHQVNYVAAELKDIPVVFPFYSSKQKTFVKDNIVKTVTSRDVLKDKVLSYFTEIYTNEKILVVGDEKLASRKEFKEIQKFLKENHDSVKEVNFLQPENGYISKERFVEKVDTLGVNWVILTTNNKVVTADVINNLKSIPNDAEVRLFAFEKAGNFDKVDNNMLAALDFVYASSGVLVDSLPGVSDFYAQYLRKNKGYPSEYASKGFDVVYDVLMRMASNDSLSLRTSFEKGASKRVRSTFDYHQKAYGEPAYNTAVYLRKYKKDLSIELLYLKPKTEEIPMEDQENIPLIENDSIISTEEKKAAVKIVAKE